LLSLGVEWGTALRALEGLVGDCRQLCGAAMLRVAASHQFACA
jgi:hypothetical protein